MIRLWAVEMNNVRSFEVIGETLVKVRCGEHLSGQWALSGTATGGVGKAYHLVNELGLATGPIKVSLIGRHSDMTINSYSKVPVDVQFDFAEAKIDMQLVHYNPALLELCYNESMGGMITNYGVPAPGTPLGKGKVIYASGCNFLGLTLWPATQARFDIDFALAGGFAVDAYLALLASLGLPAGTTAEDYAKSLVGSGAWNFWATYITMQPQAISLGTKVSVVDISWRGIVYPHFYGNTGLSSGGTPKEIPSPAAHVYSGGSIPLYGRFIPPAILDLDNEVFP